MSAEDLMHQKKISAELLAEVARRQWCGDTLMKPKRLSATAPIPPMAFKWRCWPSDRYYGPRVELNVLGTEWGVTFNGTFTLLWERMAKAQADLQKRAAKTLKAFRKWEKEL